MKKILLFLVAVLLTVNFAKAQQKVVIVNDDNYHPTEYHTIQIAAAKAGYKIDSLDFAKMPTGQDTITYDQLKDYDMVIWWMGGDRIKIHLWDSTTYKGVTTFYPALKQYYDNKKGPILIDGIDLLTTYLVKCTGNSDNDYGSITRPLDFSDGSFIHDTLGIATWQYESYTDDGGTGVTEADKASSNAINSFDNLTWKWSSLWRGDGWKTVSSAVDLYDMGPSTYAGAGNSLFFKYVNNGVTMYVSSMRLATLGNTHTISQDTINTVISEILKDAIGAPTKINKLHTANISIYPNPATNYIQLNNQNKAQIRISDICGRTLISKTVQPNAYINISELNPGIYNISIVSNNKSFSQKIVVK